MPEEALLGQKWAARTVETVAQKEGCAEPRGVAATVTAGPAPAESEVYGICLVHVSVFFKDLGKP
jgi:hypothetical protein